MSEVVPAGAKRWQVRFLGQFDPGVVPLLTFDELKRVALAEPVAVDASLPARADLLDVVCLPGGDAVPRSAQEAAEAWIAGPGLIDLVVQSDRILWRSGRALVIGTGADTYLQSLASFAFYETELRCLEGDLTTWWRVAEADGWLTHRIDRSALRRWGHVAKMTESVIGARFRHVAIEGSITRGPDPLAGSARRLFVELTMRIDAAYRLERLDDKIDVLADLYELANDRLSEFSYFRREYIMEFVIVGVLALEMALLLYELL